MQEIDVVYVLGTGTKWKDNEIRFSLRSLEKHLGGVKKVWVVGEKPEFLKNVRHIPYPDELVNNADGNIIRKVLRVCREKTLTNKFLFINDDHLVLKPIDAINVPPFHKGDLTQLPKEYFELNFWRGRLWRTRNILVKMGYPAMHFDCHTPIIFDKKLFPKVISRFPYEKATGYTMKSLYGNLVYYPDAPRLRKEKKTLFRPYTLQALRERVQNATFAAFNDAGLTADLKIWLYGLFPQASKYEKISHYDDPFMQVMNWLSDPDRDYSKGRMLFEQYGSGKKVKKFLAKGESQARRDKLDHKMKQLINYL